MKLAEVAEKLGCRLEGPPELQIRGVAGIEHAEAGQITFLANRRYFPLLKTTRASAGILEEGNWLGREAPMLPLAAFRPPNPYLPLCPRLWLFFSTPPYSSRSHAPRVIGQKP